MKSTIKYFLFIVLFLAPILVLAQSSEHQLYTANVRTFGAEHGLSHHDARSVAVDGRGLIWVGTRNGLNRFDGKRFKSFYKKDGLKSNNIELLFADGNLLICAHKSETLNRIEGISIFNTITEELADFKEWIDLPEINANNIFEIYGNESEVAFCAQVKGDTTWYLKRKGEDVLKFDFGSPLKFVGSNLDGTYWFYEKNHQRVTRRNTKGKILKEVSTKHIAFVTEGFYTDMRLGEHEKWLIASDSLYRIGKEKIHWVGSKWDLHGGQNASYLYPPEVCRVHQPSGKLWLSYISTSSLIDSTRATFFSYTENETYVNNTDYFIGNIILQPTNGGLNIFNLYPSQFQNFSTGPYGGYRSISKLGKNYLLIDNEGLKSYNKSTNQVTKDLSNTGFCATTHNNVGYVAGQDLLQIVDANLNLKRFFIPYAHEVWSMAFVDSTLLYSSSGLHQYNLTSKVSRFISSKRYPEFNEATVYHIQAKNKTEFWLCTTKGLYTFNKTSNAINLVLDQVDGVSDYQHLLVEDSIIWLASGGKGLVKFNTATDEKAFYDFGNNQTNVTHSVYKDGASNLWLSSDNGLIRFEKETGRWQIYFENDGLVNNEFNRISHFQDSDGSLFFGGVKGLVYFHPDSRIAENDNGIYLIPIVVDVFLYKKGGNKISQITKEFQSNQNLTIEPQDRFLSFDLATNSIQYYDKVVFSYKKDNDTIWSQLPSNRLAFNAMPFGRHEISVRSGLSSTYVSDNLLKFEIQVLKPLYLRTWFIAAVVLSLFALSILLIVLRTRRLNKQKNYLANEVEERTKKIKEDKDVIEKQAEELLSLDKMKNRLFANISHELRNPLTLILGPVENLLNKRDTGVPSDVRSQMLLTLKNAKNLQKRVNEILSLSKIDSGKLTLTPTAIRLNAFMKRNVLAFDSLAGMNKVSVGFYSQIDAETVALLDIDHSEKVINNLMSNAIKHSPKGGKINVELKKIKGSHYSLSVTDQGKGVPLNEQGKIFNRYYQSKEGEKAGGTGLGLALSNELAQLLGGKIEVDKNYLAGARFLFYFKAEASNEKPNDNFDINPLVSSGEQKENIELSNQHLESNVLIVDDNEEMRLYIKSILGDKCRVFEAENGFEALKVLGTRPIDLITSDLMMPEMDGMELLAELKNNEKFKNIPVIMLTARADNIDKVSALDVGVEDYITKPFYARELIARANNLLQNRKFRNEAILEEETEPKAATEEEIKSSKIIEVVQANFSRNDFTVIDIADEIGYSERQLRRILKKDKGVTPNALLREVRLLNARKLFETQQYATVAEVVYASGFKSAGHFTKSYFERFGKKPSEYFN